MDEIFMPKQKYVSIKPKDFVDDLLLMTAEEVITEYWAEEENRTNHELIANENDVAITFTNIIGGLDLALKQFVIDNRNLAVITRCLSHHLCAWYDSLSPKIYKLQEETKGIQLLLNNYIMEDLYQMLGTFRFTPMNKRPVTTISRKISLHSIKWVTGYLSEVGDAIGCDLSYLFLVGLAWSICTSNNPEVKRAGTTKVFSDEVKQFLGYLDERLIWLKAIKEIATLRIS